MLASLVLACVAASDPVDLLIDHARVYDGGGGEPFDGAIAIRGERIVAVFHDGEARPQAAAVVDAKGLAVAPGFVNMLSWSTDSLIGTGARRAGCARASRSR